MRKDTFWKSSHTRDRDAWTRHGAMGKSWEGRPGLCSLRLVLSSVQSWGCEGYTFAFAASKLCANLQ